MNTKATTVRLTDDDLALLSIIQQHTGTMARAEALRAALRGYARHEGIGWPLSRPRGRIAPSAKPKALPNKAESR
jgi:hypothetical protein